jgi:hypothetical protein
VLLADEAEAGGDRAEAGGVGSWGAEAWTWCSFPSSNPEGRRTVFSMTFCFSSLFFLTDLRDHFLLAQDCFIHSVIKYLISTYSVPDKMLNIEKIKI